MQKIFSSHPKQKRFLLRGMAMLLLSIFFFDLAVVDAFFPENCKGWEQASTTNAASFLKESQDKNLTLKTSNDKHSSSNSCSDDESCFWCCSHLLPSNFTSFSPIQTLSQPVFLTEQSLPLSDSNSIYHPPRLA